jgi:hypothetical protein
MTQKIAIVTENSNNSKTGLMSATYTPYQTCPDSCMMKPTLNAAGEFDRTPCFASCDLVGMQMHRLTRTAAGAAASLVQIAIAECKGIEALSGDRILRLKVGGDTPTVSYARRLAQACEAYTRKRKRPAFGYTHNWLKIPRQAFGVISMLASCDSIADVIKAKARGYATATIVSHFPDGAKVFEIGGVKLLPCPNQINKRIQCVDCELCCDDAKLRRLDLTIAFKAFSRKAEELAATQKAKGQ